MSDAPSKPEPTMKELEDDARLRGLMAVLALPARRTATGEFKRVLVQVEVAAGLWADVDSVVLDAESLTVCCASQCYAFRRVEGTPRWRTPEIGAMDRLAIP